MTDVDSTHPAQTRMLSMNGAEITRRALVPGLLGLESVFQETADQGSYFLCPSFSAQEGGRGPRISHLLPVSPAIRNEPQWEGQVSTFEHSKLPGWVPFCCHSDA